MAITESLPAFFYDFGVVATIGSASVTGVFDMPPAESFGIIGAAPAFTCASADVSGVSAGQAITIAGVGYTVTAVRPDGTGLTVLTLDKAS